MSASDLHTAWAELFLHAAACAGVRDVVLSPGSRSTPLALAAGRSAELRCHPIVDERSAAFFALGQARVMARPSLLVCTSGTAGAHYFPALIEAGLAYLPLVVVTSDRPWELQDSAASQTVDQRKLFGGHVRHFAELGLPDAAPSALRAVARIAAQAVALSLGPVPGPVHVNASFRKPLEPVSVAGPEPWRPAWEELVRRGPTRVSPPRRVPDERAVAELAARCAGTERGLLVCGPAPLAEPGARAAIGRLARATGFPVLAEATSQLRFGDLGEGAARCSSFDALLRAPEFRRRHRPELVIELGAPPTSAGYAAYLAEHGGAPRFVVAPHGWNDPTSDATGLLLAEPAEVAARLAALLARPGARRSAWGELFARADAAAQGLTDEALAGDRLGEGSVARAVVDACPEGALLAVGNSTPVRDLDTYCPAGARALEILHQRGAAGIDGLVSGLAGARSAAGRPVGLLLGDLSLLHDLTGLGLLRAPGPPCVVVVIDNGGGRIFDQLPVAGATDEGLFERLFAMPQPLDRAHAAAAFGLSHVRVETRAALAAALRDAWSSPRATLVEAATPPGEGARAAARLWSAVRARVASLEEGASPHDPHQGKAP